MSQEFVEALERDPMIAAIFGPPDLEEALASPYEVIFLLSGNTCGLKELIHRVHAAGRKTYIHVDLLEGIANDRSVIQSLETHFYPDGVIMAEAVVAEHAREEGIFVIQRFFLLDSKFYKTMREAVKNDDADAIEILPGILPEIIHQISQCSSVPVIAGDLIRTKKNAMDSLTMGTIGVPTSYKTLWNMWRPFIRKTVAFDS